MKTSTSRWIILIAIFVLAGCATQRESASNSTGSDPNGNDGAVTLAALQLKPSADCGDLKSYLEASWLERLTSPPTIYYAGDSGGGAVSVTGGAPAAAASAPPDDVSQTNTQEPGVDEADLVEADRNGYLYAVSNGFLVVEQGFPPEDLHEVGRVKLDAVGQALYLDEANRRVVVVASSYQYRPLPLMAPDTATILPEPVAPKVVLIFVDVADPAAPAITDRLSIDGYSVGSRRVDNRIHLVSRFWIAVPPVLLSDPLLQDLAAKYQAAVNENRSDDADGLKQELRDAIHAAVDGLDVESLLPSADRAGGAAAPLLSCEDVYRPDVRLDPGLLMVTSVDTDGGNASAVGIMNNAWLMYASRDHLYVAQTSGGWWWDGSQAQRTAIYKLALSDGRPAYVATGKVDGWVRDQFSFSDYQGYLRVASTEDRVDPDTFQWQPTNHLFVLGDDGAGVLDVVGAVRGFAPGERIFASRFLEVRGFVVTFRRVDPLFAFDLSDPANPVLKGETEVPGVSTYLHPIDRDHLLTVGRVGSNVQLQIFDISDLGHPALQHKYIPPGAAFSYSGAEYDHLAFTYYGPRNVLVIPLVTADSSFGNYFSGMAVYRVSLEDGFTELGRVDHADLAKEAYCSDVPPQDTNLTSSCAAGQYLWGAAPRRSIIMTGGERTYLYSVSDIGIKATDIEAPGVTLGRVLFPNLGLQWWPWVGVAVL